MNELTKKKLISSVLTTYADNMLAAFRTGGGLLIGNSALIYYKVLPSAVGHLIGRD